MTPAIRLEGVARSYPLDERGSGLRRLWSALRGRPSVRRRQVLRDIDLAIDHGEAVAILGRNGAGKSTLLKLVAGIGTPDRGRVAIDGRVGPLIELGAGFHAEENALANVRTAATLMGAEREDLDRVVAEAIAFSELEDHVDKPLKHYSSGMIVRLGFAVIASVRPPILLSDEVLAVGDESFQKRCIAWLREYLATGGTLLLVSHSIYHVQKLCTRAVWLDQGAIRADGDVFEVSQAYLASHEQRQGAGDDGEDATPDWVARELRISHDGAPVGATLPLAGAARLHGTVAASRALVRLLNLDGTVLWECPVGSGELDLDLPTSRLLPGRFALDVIDPERRCRMRRLLLQVSGASRRFGVYRLDHAWG